MARGDGWVETLGVQKMLVGQDGALRLWDDGGSGGGGRRWMDVAMWGGDATRTRGLYENLGACLQI